MGTKSIEDLQSIFTEIARDNGEELMLETNIQSNKKSVLKSTHQKICSYARSVINRSNNSLSARYTSWWITAENHLHNLPYMYNILAISLEHLSGFRYFAFKPGFVVPLNPRRENKDPNLCLRILNAAINKTNESVVMSKLEEDVKSYIIYLKDLYVNSKTFIMNNTKNEMQEILRHSKRGPVVIGYLGIFSFSIINSTSGDVRVGKKKKRKLQEAGLDLELTTPCYKNVLGSQNVVRR